MKSSYKIAIVTLVVILVIVFAYYMKQPDNSPQAAIGEETPTNSTTAASGGTSGGGGSLVASSSNPNPPSMDDLMKKVRSHLDQAEASTTGSTGTPGSTGGARTTSPDAISTPRTLRSDSTTTIDPSIPVSTATPARPVATIGPTTQPSPASALGGPTTQPIQNLYGDDAPASAGQTAGITVIDRNPRTSVVGSTPRANAGTYTIKSGDTFSSIAEEKLGSGKRWVDIAQANPMVDPSKLKVGMVIRLPGHEPAPSEPATEGTRSTDATGATERSGSSATYTVKPGDTLSSIAQQYYGNRGKWKTIYNANRATIGSDPGALDEGMKLVIPPAPTPAR